MKGAVFLRRGAGFGHQAVVEYKCNDTASFGRQILPVYTKYHDILRLRD